MDGEKEEAREVDEPGAPWQRAGERGRSQNGLIEWVVKGSAANATKGEVR